MGHPVSHCSSVDKDKVSINDVCTCVCTDIQMYMSTYHMYQFLSLMIMSGSQHYYSCAEARWEFCCEDFSWQGCATALFSAQTVFQESDLLQA